MKLYIVRHGETDWNRMRRLQGHSNTQLNERGKELARITGEALKNVCFSRCYSSPLDRAVQTAQLILGDRCIPICKEDRICEIGFGVYEGLSCLAEANEIPDPDFMYFFTAPEKYRHPEGGESIQQLCARTTAFLQEITHRSDLEEENILLVTHGAALRGLLSSIQMKDLSQFWGEGVSKNCSVTILEAHGGKVKILEENKTWY